MTGDELKQIDKILDASYYMALRDFYGLDSQSIFLLGCLISLQKRMFAFVENGQLSRNDRKKLREYKKLHGGKI